MEVLSLVNLIFLNEFIRLHTVRETQIMTDKKADGNAVKF